jgi:hypothetical protein
MMHPAHTGAWKALDVFGSSFARDARNVRIGLVIYVFSPFNVTVTSYPCWPMFCILYNLPPTLCMKYDLIFLGLVIAGSKHLGTQSM